MVLDKSHIDQIRKCEVLTETSAQPSAVSGDTTFELSNDDAIGIVQHAEDSVLLATTGVIDPISHFETNSNSTAFDTP